MTPDEKNAVDEQFEKVKEGLGPDEKTSYAPADTGDVKDKAERVRREIREDRRRASDD
jgi:hypothetical protein